MLCKCIDKIPSKAIIVHILIFLLGFVNYTKSNILNTCDKKHLFCTNNMVTLINYSLISFESI